MSPVEKGPRVSGRAALVVGLAGVLAGLGLVALVTFLAGRGDVVEVRLGDDTFGDLDTDRISSEIDERGPILFPDPVGGVRSIYLQHLGDDVGEGWFAFDAFQPGADDDCLLEWDPDAERFVDPCDGATFAADGDGLPQYPAVVEDGRVDIDLNAAFRTTTTTEPPSEATTPIRGSD